MNHQCRFLLVPYLAYVIELDNRTYTEHLELAVENSESCAKKAKNAAAIFLGNFTPEEMGDYLAGPNHVLPTSCTARLSSPLGVYDFIKRTSLIGYARTALQKNADSVTILAEMEGLDAHAEAVKIRLR